MERLCLVTSPGSRRDNRTVWVSREGLDAERLKFGVRTAGGEDFDTKPVVLDEQQRFRVHDPSGQLVRQ